MENKEINTGLIMDSVGSAQLSNQVKMSDDEKKQSVIDNQKAMQMFAEYKKAHTPKVREYKIGRNDPCPCGSGKKYKNCCLDSGKYENLVLKNKKQ